MLEILVQNVRRGTFLVWNGGAADANEYVRGRTFPAGYCRLVIDRLAFSEPSNLPGIAGRLASAKRLLKGAGVIEVVTHLVPLQRRYRCIDEAEMASISEEWQETVIRPLSPAESRQLWQELAKVVTV